MSLAFSAPLAPSRLMIPAPAQPCATPRPASAQPTPVLDILEVNDLHESYTRWPHLVSAFDRISQWSQQQGHATLRLDAGDNLIGMEPSDIPLMATLMNRLGLHAAVPGNHDFDLGTPGLRQLAQASQFPWLGANLASDQTNPDSWLVKRAVLAQNGQRFGLIGVTTPKLLSLINPENPMEGLAPETAEQTAREVQHQVDILQGQGIRNIILLSHMGYKADKALIDPAKGGVTGVDIIVGGHSHTALDGIIPGKTLFQDKAGDPVLILQTGKNGENVGVTEVAFNPAGQVMPMALSLLPSSLFPADEATHQIIEQALGPEKPVAQLSQLYNDKHIQEGDDAMVNLAADSLLCQSGADLALVSSASIKQGAPAGPLTNWHLREMVPFDTSYHVADVTGQQLLNTLSQLAVAAQHHEHHPSLLHPSANLRYQLDPARGQVTQALHHPPNQPEGWQPLNPNQHYKVAMDNFGLTSNEYPAIKGSPIVGQVEGSMRDWLATSLYAQHQPVLLAPDGRVDCQRTDH